MLDPASLPADRRARRVETDRRHAARMLRALAAIDRGGPLAPDTARVPSVEEEDRRPEALASRRMAAGKRNAGRP